MSDHGRVQRRAALVASLVAFTLGVTSALLVATPKRADAACSKVKFVGVRGSGDESDPRGLGNLIGPLYDAFATRYGDPTAVSFYGLPYPAHGIDTAVKLSLNVVYQQSKNNGRDALRAFLEDEASACPRQKLVLAGYSQGAHVVADVLSDKVGRLSPETLERIAAVELFGDPRFNSREAFDRGSFRLGRNGVLGARSPGDLDSVNGKIRSWCRFEDVICQGPGNTDAHSPAAYLSDYTEEALSFLKQKVGTARVAPTPPTVVQTTPPPTAPSLNIGDRFNDQCVVAWPTAPVISSTAITMRMTCKGVSTSRFLFVDVAYGDSSLKVTPSTGYMQVTGRIVDISRSQLGFSTLNIVATQIRFL